jgi:lipopolysaccharide biosynthesis regulator YciM
MIIFILIPAAYVTGWYMGKIIMNICTIGKI